MFIATEDTPNPATLKFLPGREIAGALPPVGFTNPADAAEQSPLAQRLFQIEGVVGVFLGRDFVTITRADQADWVQLRAPILGALMEHLLAARPILLIPAATPADPAAAAEDDDEIIVQIKELLETRVRPAVARDGGDITFHSFDDGVVYLTMQGSCSGCPSSTMTLKAGIENLLAHYIPEVREVRAI